jgi:predicted DNA-binding transcriptional regulator YafY
MSAASRRKELVFILRRREMKTIGELAHEIGTSRSTVKRYLLALEEEGYYFETKRGNGGGVLFLGQRNQYKSVLNQEETAQMTEWAQETGGKKARILKKMLEVCAYE